MTDKVEVRMNFNDPNELAERYTAVWMEPDGDRRRQAIADVWSDDAIHISSPRRRSTRPPLSGPSTRPGRCAATTNSKRG